MDREATEMSAQMNEWIKEVWYIWTMEYSSVIKENETLPFAATWMDQDIIILHKDTQTEKHK